MKPTTLFLLLILTLLLICCNNQENIQQSTPNETIESFFMAFQKNNYDKASLLCTPKSAQSLRDFTTNLKMVEKQEKEALVAPFLLEIKNISFRYMNRVKKDTCPQKFRKVLTLIERSSTPT